MIAFTGFSFPVLLCLGLFSKGLDGLHSCCHLIVVNTIVDKFTIAFGFDDTGIAKNAQVLRSNGLLQVKRAVYLIDANTILRINVFHNLHSQGVC